MGLMRRDCLFSAGVILLISLFSQLSIVEANSARVLLQSAPAPSPYTGSTGTETATFYAALGEAGNYSTLISLLEATHLGQVITAQPGQTLLAPSDDAFDNISADAKALLMGNQGQIAYINLLRFQTLLPSDDGSPYTYNSMRSLAATGSEVHTQLSASGGSIPLSLRITASGEVQLYYKANELVATTLTGKLILEDGHTSILAITSVLIPPLEYLVPGVPTSGPVGSPRLKGHHPPGVGHHPKGTGGHGSGKGHHPPGKGHHASGEGHHPPGVGHHMRR